MLPCLKNVKQLFKKMLFRGIANEILFYIVYAHLESVLLQIHISCMLPSPIWGHTSIIMAHHVISPTCKHKYTDLTSQKDQCVLHKFIFIYDFYVLFQLKNTPAAV